MRTVVITDGMYRSALAAARAFGKAGFRVLVTQTREESPKDPPAFFSRWCEGHRISGSVKDEAYPDRLEEFLRGLNERPILFCVGAATLNMVAAQRERFSPLADFLIAPPEVLDALNDKQTVHDRAQALGLPVPKEYSGTPDAYPVVIKPHCGEKQGIKAADRYTLAANEEEYRLKLEKMRVYDPQPIVQERIIGDGRGVSLLLGRNSELLEAVCHRRLREYPMSGGPSTCCISEYDEARIRQAYSLLKSFGFVGLAMVEFKGDCILEVNPRIWGSFPLTVVSDCPMCLQYARAAEGETVEYKPENYRIGQKMRFCFNDLAACADLLRHGKIKAGLSGLLDFFRIREALYDPEDKKAYQKYLRSYF